jgi:hypothetical protein
MFLRFSCLDGFFCSFDKLLPKNSKDPEPKKSSWAPLPRLLQPFAAGLEDNAGLTMGISKAVHTIMKI